MNQKRVGHLCGMLVGTSRWMQSPEAHLSDVLTKLINNWPNSRLAELTPFDLNRPAPRIVSPANGVATTGGIGGDDVMMSGLGDLIIDGFDQRSRDQPLER